MKKKQVALLLAALMCITPMAESAAVMGAEFSSGEETDRCVRRPIRGGDCGWSPDK